MTVTVNGNSFSAFIIPRDIEFLVIVNKATKCQLLFHQAFSKVNYAVTNRLFVYFSDNVRLHYVFQNSCLVH